MSRCQFLLDECVPAALARGLRRRLPEVVVARVGEGDAPAKGVSDLELLAYCEQRQMILITADRSTFPDWIGRHLSAGHHTWGVLVVATNQSASSILNDLVLVYSASERDEWVDVLYYLPLGMH